MTKLPSRVVVDALQPELDQLVESLNVEPDEREAFGNASLALFTACQRMTADHDLDWPADATLAAVEAACYQQSMLDHAAAVQTIRDYNTWARGEQARNN